jgi:amino acid adenylation domain-containing protein
MKAKHLEDAYPLSPLQQGMLFHALNARQAGVDVEQVFLHLPERVDLQAFQDAWQFVTDRHAILRTSFAWVNLKAPQQEVRGDVRLNLDLLDWRRLSVDEQEERWTALLGADRQRGFDLTRAPLLRVTLVHLGRDEHRLLFTFHHLLLDGRALVIVLTEVFAAYEAFRKGRPPSLPAAPPYRAFIDWLEQRDREADRSFWRGHLERFSAPTQLPFSCIATPASAGDPPSGERRLALSPETTDALRALARARKLTLNTLLQGAWAVLLSRCSGQADVLFGVVREGRKNTVPDANSIVGLCINTVPLRVQVPRDLPWVTWLQQLRADWQAMRPHEHASLVDIHGWSEIPRHAPLFETLFNFQEPAWFDALRALGGKWERREAGIRSQPGYPLVVDASAGATLQIQLLHDRRRFDDATAERMLGHLQTLLEGMLANPDGTVGELPMLTEAERHQLLVEWNDTRAPYPHRKCVHELIEEQAGRTPDALAVADAAARLTYRELNARADVVARCLRTRGVHEDVTVGVCFPRSAGMVVALLGVLKAGGAYVAMDPSYPANRLAYLLGDARAAALLTTSGLRHTLREEVGETAMLTLDELLADAGEDPAKRPHRRNGRRPHPTDLAYVIYTSGSTGTPKGVAVEHRSLVNLIAWHRETYGLSSADRTTQLASPAFDASVWELWPYLAVGASVHIPEDATARAPDKLLRWLAAQAITFSFVPTPLAEALLDLPWPEDIALRALLTGGDRLRRWPDDHLPCLLINHYGPTENTVVTTWTPLPPGPDATGNPPIGRPINNVSVYVLDEQGELAPIGVPGELHVGGDGLARGYLNRAGQTGARFIRHPFSDQAGARLYRTGDRVRWRSDGLLEFLGRLDEQVKIRGHRIEPGEIEAALAQHSAVNRCIVTLQTDSANEARLVAHVVPGVVPAPGSGDLRQFLAEKLPEHMIPSAFVFLEQLPLTSNGKVDRRALPAAAPVAGQELPFEAPQSDLERSLATLWCGVLGVERISRHDHFFDLGGHSLRAMQLLGRLRADLGVDLPLRALFEAPTLSDLAARIEAERQPSGGPAVQSFPAAWQGKCLPLPEHTCVHQLFEAQAVRAPDAVALVFEDRTLTYRELNDAAERWGAYLRELGVSPDATVGLCVERSPEMLVGMLAILKAGGAYVPLDPDHPASRRAFMLADCQARVLVTQSSLRASFDPLPDHCRVVCLDEPPPAPAGHPDRGWRCVVRLQPRPHHLAYVMYTSGSTGTPKGVMVTHRNVVNFFTGMDELLGERPGVWLAVTTFAFDISVLELLWTLARGWRVVLAGSFPGMRAADDSYGSLIQRHAVTHLQCTPSLARMLLLEPGAPEALRALSALLIGGEALPLTLARRLKETLTGRLWNMYGPTEATVWATAGLIEELRDFVPLGRPLANAGLFVLDEHRQPVPAGEPGELYLGGEGLARGYLNRASQTAERFLPHPFSAEPGARLYRTGDRVCWHADGRLEFLGRMDDQVKLRGHRIELGEIEALLGRHPAVRQCAVTLRSAMGDDACLAAYVAAAPPAVVEAGALRGYLQERLPDYMIPSTFTFLAQLPLTPNGKVDRRALPAPEPVVPPEDSFEPPQSDRERKLAALWTEVLGVGRVGRQDNFFDLGGNSLRAMQIVWRVRGALHLDLPVRDLFEHPTLAALAARLDALAADPATKPVEPSPSLPARTTGDETWPLSFAQERFWFLEQLSPGLAMHNIPLAFRLRGPLHVGALRRGLEEITHRHASLRCVFVEQAGGAVALVLEPKPFVLPLTDLSAFKAARRRDEADRFVREESRMPFDLSQGRLLRAKLLHLAGDDHLLLLTTHHLVCDGWSLAVLLRELAALHDAFAQNQAPLLPALPLSYGDAVRAQRQRLAGAPLEQQLDWWRRQLRGAPETLDLPFDRPRPAVLGYSGATHHFVLPADVAAALRQLARRHDATLYMLLLAAFETLIHRYTGREDLLIGSPVAGRTQAHHEPLVGLFLNTLALRADLSGDPPFTDLLARTRRSVLEAFAHQELPFERLVEALQPRRDLSRPPLVQVMFTLQNQPAHALPLAGLSVEPMNLDNGSAKFDLTLYLEERGGPLHGAVEFNTDLFDAATITRLTGHFQTLLEGIVARPGTRVSALPLLTTGERESLLSGWNDTSSAFPQDACIHDLIQRRCARHPREIALVSGDRQVTFRELNNRAEALAAVLQTQGVGPDVPVGLCLERSPKLVVALLAVLKAGGAYVPLDPAFPPQRLAFMLADCEAPVLITETRLRERCAPVPDTCRVLCMDDPASLSAAHEPPSLQTAVRLRPRPHHLAYILYTSGSTGTPKGVPITHRNVVAFLHAMQRRPGLAHADVMLAVTTLSFDIAALELLLPLMVGARIVLATAEDGARLRDLLDRSGATVMQATPSTWRLLLSSGWRGTPGLKALCGGEPLPRDLAGALLSRCGELWNLYGPTETTIWSARHRVEQGEGPVPIGRPIENTQLHILDRHGQLLPVGVPGELHIGGAGVAHGYHRRPELTAEKFVPDPFRNDPRARLYRTGDLACRLPDGTIRFLGRLDHQVKLRGHRIELEEIEHALRRHDAVRDCVVLAREDTPGDQRLVAWIVAAGSPAPAAGQLRAFLAATLPEYMVPGAFHFLDDLPRTPNGKLDRQALTTGPLPDADACCGFVPPDSPLERGIAEIWQQVLGLERVGLDDNFFDLGGHSLLLAQVQAKLADMLGCELTMVELFQHPTVRALAARLREPRTGPRAGADARARAQRQRAAMAGHAKRGQEAYA